MYKKKTGLKRKNNNKKNSFAKKVKSVLSKTLETKQQSHSGGMTAYNSGISAIGDVNRVLPSVAQGVDDGQRVGSKITATSLQIKGHYILNQSYMSTASNARIGVRMMVVTPRKYQHTTDAIANATAWLPVLLKKGNTDNAFTGTIENLYQSINRDQVIVHYDKVSYMTMPQVNFYTAVASDTTNFPVNSTKFFTINLKCRNKVLTFDEGSNYPYQYGPVVLIGYSHLDGSAADAVETQLSMQYFSTITYKDA